MANAVQHYQLNEDFQLSTVNQLTAFDADEYKWVGRTLTSWTNELCGTLPLDAAVSFPDAKQGISANWKLNEYKISVDFKTGHGKVIVTTSCDEMPLPFGIASSVELEKDAQTSSNILYNSLLSIDAVPENEEYETTRFDVNGAPQVLSDQYVYKNNSTNDKTGTNKFNVAVGFNTNLDVAGVSVFTVDESATRVPYSTLPANTLQMFDSDGNPVSPFDGYEKIKKLSAAGVVDPHSLVSAIGDYSFKNCKNLSVVDCAQITSVGDYAFYYCENLYSIKLDNVKHIGSHAFENSPGSGSGPVYGGAGGVSSILLPSIETIGDYAFANCARLSSVECSSVVTIGERAFGTITNNFNYVKISSINIPSVSVIRPGTFAYCEELLEADLENAISISLDSTPGSIDYNGAFANCSKLSSVNAPRLKYIGHGAFAKCRNLSSISLPTAIKIYTGWGSFSGCTALTSINMPDLSAIYDHSGAFENCINLTTVNFPKLESLYSSSETFQNCSSLETACIPVVTQLPARTFKGCTNLVSAYIPAVSGIAIAAFSGCDSLTSVDLPETVSIGQQSFENCLSLTAVNCPKLTSINKSNVYYPIDNTSFSGCGNLLSIRVDNGTLSSTENGYGIDDQLIMQINGSKLEYAAPAIIHAKNDLVLAVEQRAFLKHLNLETVDFDNAISVGQCAFAGCTNLSQVNFPNIRKIDNQAFIDDINLLTVDMPELTSIAYNAFGNCSKMHNAKFQSLRTIGQNAFTSCEALSSIECPVVSSINAEAFSNCKNLISVDMPLLSSIKNGYIFSDCTSLISVDMPRLSSITASRVFKNCTNLKTIDNLPLTSIVGLETFYNCTALTSINLPHISGLIGSSTDGLGVFGNCTNLVSARLENISALGPSAFENCTKLEYVNISRCKNIHYDAFNGCEKLSSVILSNNNETVTTIYSSNVFKNIGHLVSVYIPDGMTESYRANANWAQLENNLCVQLVECQLPAEEMIPSGTPVKTEINSFNYGNEMWW